MDSIVYWYKTEVQFWRSAGSLFWGVTCLIPLTVLFVFLSHFSLLQPWEGFTGFLTEACSFSFIMGIGVVMAVFVSVFYSATFTVVPDVPSTRLTSYLSLLYWSRLPHLLVSTVGGGCVAWCCSHFMGNRFYGLTAVHVGSERELLMINESHLFLVLSGIVAGLVYYTNFYLAHFNYLTFPTLQREKYFRSRSEVMQLAKQCLRLLWRHLRVFYLGYLIFGGICKSWVMGILNVDASAGHQQLNTLYGLLDINLLWQTSLCSFFIIFTWSLMAVLYRVYHTQCLQIPLVPAFGTDPKHCLTEALNSVTTPRLQHLAFLDLAFLSAHNPQRRQQVFSLSQPGGHPHIWRSVCGACLLQVDTLTSQVHTTHLNAVAALPVQQLPAEKIFSIGGDSSVVYRGSSQSQSILQSPGVETVPSSPAVTTASIPVTTKVYSALKDKPVLNYFLMDLPDSKSKRVFAGSQIHIWAIEALSQLAEASYEEDNYGLVQLTLPAIVTSLISLHDTLEKYFKLQPMTVRRVNKDWLLLPHIALCQQLRDSLKTAIYRMTNRFGKHLSDLHLHPDCVKRLRPFLEYKE